MNIKASLKLFCLLGCLQSPFVVKAETPTITVAVAANFQYTFEEILAEFKKDKNIEVQSVVGSSGKLTAQIKNGAPFDIFISADTAYPEAICKEKLCALPLRVYASGTLVLWTLNNLDLSKGLGVLSEAAIKKIAVPNPQTAPYGREALKALSALHLEKSLEAKFVYGESISQASQYIASKAADIGFTAKAMVLSKEMLNKGKWIEVPSNLYSPIAQAAVLLKGKNEKSAKEFYDYLYTDKTKTILAKYAYKLP